MENQDKKQNKLDEKNVLNLALQSDNSEMDYQIEIHNKFITIDKEVNKRLKNAGLSNEQAQLVYDLAGEVLIPKLQEVIEDFRAYRELSKLENYFGGEEKFDEVSRQISLWAEKNLPEEIFNSLNSSFYGVIALYNMMNSGEPQIMSKSGVADDVITEKKLKEMMSDPRYWRDGDKNFIKKVEDGFKFLYGDE